MELILVLIFCAHALLKVSGQECEVGNYTGTVSITNGGRLCQRWAEQVPHLHQFSSNDSFPIDGSAEQADNYCRSVDNDPLPWCYTQDIYKRWEYCDTRICGGNTCGGIITDESGMIQSLDVDGDGMYEIMMDCLWTLMAPEGMFIHLEFLTFDLEPSSGCEFDVLVIYEKTIIHGRFCGSTSPPDIRSASRVLYVRFDSDQFDVGAGFVANFSQVDEGLTKVPTKYTSGELVCSADENLLRYYGSVSTTNGGHECLAWTVTSFQNDLFPMDGTKKKAKNYCRNIASSPYLLPWCLSKDTLRPELCHEVICSKVDDIVTTEASSTLGLSKSSPDLGMWTHDLYTTNIKPNVSFAPFNGSVIDKFRNGSKVKETVNNASEISTILLSSVKPTTLHQVDKHPTSDPNETNSSESPGIIPTTAVSTYKTNPADKTLSTKYMTTLSRSPAGMATSDQKSTQQTKSPEGNSSLVGNGCETIKVFISLLSILFVCFI